MKIKISNDFEMEFKPHKARKGHYCDAYFTRHCAGFGWIEKGDIYWSPENDCKDAFHPFRICSICFNGYVFASE